MGSVSATFASSAPTRTALLARPKLERRADASSIAVYVLSTIPTWYLVDIWGRRPILLAGALVMSAALSSVGYFLYLDKSFTPTAVVVSVIVFNAAFGFSWGPIPWLCASRHSSSTMESSG